MRTCKQCDSEMVNGFDIKVDGASYGIKITKNSTIFSERKKNLKLQFVQNVVKYHYTLKNQIKFQVDNISKNKKDNNVSFNYPFCFSFF